MSDSSPLRISRRTALKWGALAAGGRRVAQQAWAKAQSYIDGSPFGH